MKKWHIFYFCIGIFLISMAEGFAQDAALVVAAIEKQTNEERTWNLQQLNNMIEQLAAIKQQIQTTNEMLSIEQWRKEGLDMVDAISPLPNKWVGENEFIDGIKTPMEKLEDLQDEWKSIFGDTHSIFEITKVDSVGENMKEVLKNVDISDRTNTISYSVGNSFQKKYTDNTQYSRRLAEISKGVNEKTALRMIAEELAQLIELQNQMVYLMAQSLKSNSVEYSSESLARKEEIAEFESECEGVKRFININKNAGA